MSTVATLHLHGHHYTTNGHTMMKFKIILNNMYFFSFLFGYNAVEYTVLQNTTE